jgi:hypothetical protein
MPEVDRHVSQWQRQALIGKASAAKVTSCFARPHKHVMVAFMIAGQEPREMIEYIDGRPNAVQIFA